MKFLNDYRIVVLGMVTLVFLLSTSVPAGAGYEEAKKEGSAVLYTSLNLEDSQPLVDAFTARYPGIKVEVNRQGSSTLVTKILTERRVGKRDNADLVLTGADSLDLMLMETPTIFQKYNSSERPPEERGLYSGVYFTILTIAYNSRVVSGADVPETLQRSVARSLERQNRHQPEQLRLDLRDAGFFRPGQGHGFVAQVCRPQSASGPWHDTDGSTVARWRRSRTGLAAQP